MIIMWGFKVLYSKVKAVTFVCSHCGADREGTLRRARRWFTLFFIPIVPTKDLGQVVQCGTCNNRFAPRILDVPTTAQSTEHLANAYRCGVVAMVRASGNSSQSCDAAVALMRDRNQQYDIATLEFDLANTTDMQIDAWLTHLSVMLNPLGKERFFSGMAAVALADGAIDEAERAVLERIGRGLLLTPAQLHGLLDLTRQQSAP